MNETHRKMIQILFDGDENLLVTMKRKSRNIHRQYMKSRTAWDTHCTIPRTKTWRSLYGKSESGMNGPKRNDGCKC